MLPHRAVCANLDAIQQATDYGPDDDVLVSWLPLYHDMGLVGILTLCMSFGGDLALAGPQDFMASPSRWVRWMSDYGATATAGPNFAWVLATKAMRRLDGLDLSPMRVALNGAEPVDADKVRAFATGRLAHYKIPRYVMVVEEFPMTVTGKIRKVEMREEAARRLGL